MEAYVYFVVETILTKVFRIVKSGSPVVIESRLEESKFSVLPLRYATICATFTKDVELFRHNRASTGNRTQIFALQERYNCRYITEAFF